MLRLESGQSYVFHADNLALLQALPDASADLIYLDPPFKM
jgi:16S rRNA G966 N2-methylase RsmD